MSDRVTGRYLGTAQAACMALATRSVSSSGMTLVATRMVLAGFSENFEPG